jgi:hypothetical protein
MTKKNKSTPPKAAKTSTLPMPSTRHWLSRFVTFRKRMVALIGLVAAVVSLLVLFPRVSVTPQENLNAYDPLTAPFLLSNDGYATINSAHFLCHVDLLIGTNGNKMARGVWGGYGLGDIAPNGHTTLLCEPFTDSSGGFSQAHITLAVTFRPDWYPWHITRKFPFVGKMGDNRIIRWLPVSK